ncbi:hypothetical protein TrVE_jg14232 [Triparma verrucosa]|uniref:Uncharacterized protein n=2 Tax=Triparma TaxID=722752 RepID=A0A9W7E9G7_9STRA|nr:hypothetical protein TrST_g4893 [Triparma strigata]GMH85139.1 hypothetical protein TrVE_jg14232 [Triparma verrucosa]
MKKRRREVQVVVDGADFPWETNSQSSKPKPKGALHPPSSGAPSLPPSSLSSDEVQKYKKFATKISSNDDFNKMFKEVQTKGQQQFTGYAKKLYKEEDYEKKTGKKLKRQSVPRNILAGMIKKQAGKEEKAERIAREAGIVTAKKKKGKRKSYSEASRKDSQVAGPAPNIGFMSGGMFKVNK